MISIAPNPLKRGPDRHLCPGLTRPLRSPNPTPPHPEAAAEQEEEVQISEAERVFTEDVEKTRTSLSAAFDTERDIWALERAELHAEAEASSPSLNWCSLYPSGWLQCRPTPWHCPSP